MKVSREGVKRFLSKHWAFLVGFVYGSLPLHLVWICVSAREPGWCPAYIRFVNNIWVIFLPQLLVSRFIADVSSFYQSFSISLYFLAVLIMTGIVFGVAFDLIAYGLRYLFGLRRGSNEKYEKT